MSEADRVPVRKSRAHVLTNWRIDSEWRNEASCGVFPVQSRNNCTPAMKKILNVVLLFATYSATAQVATPAALKSELLSATQASLISLEGINPISCPEVSMSQTWDGGKLIFSDSPESPTTRGMLYIDTNLAATASGVPNRIFAYHANGDSSSQLKFSVLIKNNGSSSGTLTVVQHGLAGPSTDYAYVGKLTFYRWLTNAALSGVTVPAGQTVRLGTNFD